MASDVLFQGVSKRYGDVCAVANLTLRIPERGIMAILGPSGSGKTTVLNICAGVIAPTSGHVFIGGRDITHTPIEERNIGVVFQSYALFPHLSVLENVAFALTTKRHRVSRDEARRRAAEMLHTVGLRGCEDRKPKELSGGQQQRVALARALVYRPRLLLLDEPLGALDPSLKQQLQDDVLRLRNELGVTVVYVTHDQQEAMSIADQIAVMRRGELEQLGSPRSIYEQPANEFVARFIGEANLIHGRVERLEAETMVVDIGKGRLRVRKSADASVGRDVLLLVRPEAISAAVASRDDVQTMNRLLGGVRRVSFLGSFVRILVDIAPDLELRVNCSSAAAHQSFQAGQTVDLCWQITDTYVVGATRQAEPTTGTAEGYCDQPLGFQRREAYEEAR